MSELRPRGLGRGLSALLGEPVKTETPKPANAPAWTQPQPAPAEPPRNVYELPTTNAQPPQTPAPQSAPQPQAGAPKQAAGESGPRSIPIDQVHELIEARLGQEIFEQQMERKLNRLRREIHVYYPRGSFMIQN